MLIVDQHLKDIFNAVDALHQQWAKKLKSVKRANMFVKEQETFLFRTIMPPLIGSKIKLYTRNTLIMQCHRMEMCSQKDLDEVLDYLDKKVINVFKNPKATDEDKRAAFTRIASLVYIVEYLISFLSNHDLIEVSDSFRKEVQEHTYAALNFIHDVQTRKQEKGVFGISGDNFKEIDKFVSMTSKLILAIPICDWYHAYLYIFNRFLFTRLGGDISTIGYYKGEIDE